MSLETNTPPLIYVDLVEEKVPTYEEYAKPRGFATTDGYQRYAAKFQPWRVIVKSGDNEKILFRSSERYFNRLDALKATRLAFGDTSTVYLRESEKGNQLLRRAADS